MWALGLELSRLGGKHLLAAEPSCQPSLYLTFWIRSLTEPGTPYFVQTGSRASSKVFLYPLPEPWDYKGVQRHTAFDVSPRDPRSGPHACVAGT